MKVCLLSRSDGRGGGYAAAYRLHQGLIQHGIESQLLVSEKTRDDSTISLSYGKRSQDLTKLITYLDALPKRFYRHRQNTPYSVQWVPDQLDKSIKQSSPDIINLHWINDGFLKIETLAQFKRPIVWTLHDMWAFTGGCHYSGECDAYVSACGKCPQLGSHTQSDLSNWIWKRKASAWEHLDLTIVTPSHWLAKCAAASSLFRNLQIEVIPNGLDTNLYKPIEKAIARNILGLPQDKKLILFGAVNSTSDSRKGFSILKDALNRISETSCSSEIELIVFGAPANTRLPDIQLENRSLGKLNDDISLSLVYSAADIFVAPSIQDNLPNTVMESLSCGTPCIAFDIGGMPDMIKHGETGYLAQPFDPADLANMILQLIEDSDKLAFMSSTARKRVEEQFTLAQQAVKYSTLFEKLCTGR